MRRRPGMGEVFTFGGRVPSTVGILIVAVVAAIFQRFRVPLFLRLLRLEKVLMRYVDLPFGTSLLAIARKV